MLPAFAEPCMQQAIRANPGVVNWINVGVRENLCVQAQREMTRECQECVAIELVGRSIRQKVPHLISGVHQAVVFRIGKVRIRVGARKSKAAQRDPAHGGFQPIAPGIAGIVVEGFQRAFRNPVALEIVFGSEVKKRGVIGKVGADTSADAHFFARGSGRLQPHVESANLLGIGL